MALDEPAMMSPPPKSTVEFHNAVEFQGYASTANVNYRDQPPKTAQHYRSRPPSLGNSADSDSSLDSSDDARVMAMIDAVSTNSSSDGDPQGAPKVPFLCQALHI